MSAARNEEGGGEVELDLLYLQILSDVFNGNCPRLSEADTDTLLDTFGEPARHTHIS